MIPAFKGCNHFSAAALIGYIHENPCQTGKTGGRNLHSSQRVLVIRIEPGRDKDQLGFKLHGDGIDNFFKNLDVLSAVCARSQGHIDIVSDTLPPSDFFYGACTRIVRILVSRKIQYPRVLIELRLRAVAMVQIPVNYQNPLHLMLGNSVHGAYGNIIKEAETGRIGHTRMMSGRSDKGKGILNSAGNNAVYGV